MKCTAIEKKIERRLEKYKRKRPAAKIPLSEEIAEIFEKWRRGKE